MFDVRIFLRTGRMCRRHRRHRCCRFGCLRRFRLELKEFPKVRHLQS
jgi:hypothetical protein